MSDAKYIKMLNILCPMHVIVGRSGIVCFAGPTAQKLIGETSLLGRNFLDVFEIRRPRSVKTLADLRRTEGTKLHLRSRLPPYGELKGVLAEGPETGQVTVNLSFGISILDAVREHSLTAADFAATDLTVEMLYLVEAKSAAMEASRQLTSRLQGARVAAEEQAFTDTLTGLKNRRAMDHVLARLIAGDTPFAVMNIDLDFFKAVNDTLGHAAGDHVLQHVARVLVAETREADTVARVGGDEFVILAPAITDAEILEALGRRIIDRLEVPINFNGQTCTISSSIGTTLSDFTMNRTPEQILSDADRALYASKRSGRARQTIFDKSMRETV